VMHYTDLYEAMRPGGDGDSVRRWAADALAAVLADVRSAPTAMRHPLGFVCLPLVRDGDLGVCVHVWAPGLGGVTPTTSPVHSHSWDLRSFVLYGGVRNDRVDVTDVTTAPTHRVFEVHSAGDVDEIRPTPRLVRCAQVNPQTSRAGEVYTLPAGEFHMTVIEDDQHAATVVLGRTRSGVGDLSLGAPQLASHRVRRVPCDPAETVLAARLVTGRLAAHHAT
jgi:hypothetical protein